MEPNIKGINTPAGTTAIQNPVTLFAFVKAQCFIKPCLAHEQKRFLIYRKY